MHESRKKSINTLKNMMQYGGRFPILVIGDSGVGKTHWVNKNVKSIKGDDYRDNIVSIDSGLSEENKEYWLEVFKTANNKFLLIEEVEKLSNKSQEIIFNLLSTENGKYGLEKKDLVIRIIFTSCFPIQKLRDDRRFLSSKFFDRVSQFVVKFPNFQHTQRGIYDDFLETWEKFFDEEDIFHEKYPKSTDFKKWLDTIAGKLHGNFRDLDKIVINWNLQQVSMPNTNEEDILKVVKKDFTELLRHPSQLVYAENTFVFIEDDNYEDILHNFKMKLKNWSLQINNNDKIKAAKMLGISYRTMERWK